MIMLDGWDVDLKPCPACGESLYAHWRRRPCLQSVQMKPDYQDAQRRNGILKREAFLLSEYEKELRRA